MVLLVYPERPNERVSFAEAHAGFARDLQGIVDRVSFAVGAGVTLQVPDSCTRGPQKCVRDGRKWVDFASADRLADIVQCSRPAAAASQRAEKLKSAARRGCDECLVRADPARRRYRRNAGELADIVDGKS